MVIRMKKKHAQNITENSGVQYEQNNNAAKELTNTSDETINEDKNKTMDCREHCMH